MPFVAQKRANTRLSPQLQQQLAVDPRFQRAQQAVSAGLNQKPLTPGEALARTLTGVLGQFQAKKERGRAEEQQEEQSAQLAKIVAGAGKAKLGSQAPAVTAPQVEDPGILSRAPVNSLGGQTGQDDKTAALAQTIENLPTPGAIVGSQGVGAPQQLNQLAGFLAQNPTANNQGTAALAGILSGREGAERQDARQRLQLDTQQQIAQFKALEDQQRVKRLEQGRDRRNTATNQSRENAAALRIAADKSPSAKDKAAVQNALDTGTQSVQILDEMLKLPDSALGTVGSFRGVVQNIAGAAADVGSFVGGQVQQEIESGLASSDVLGMFDENLTDVEFAELQTAYALARSRKGSGRLNRQDIENARKSTKFTGIGLSSDKARSNAKRVREEIIANNRRFQKQLGGTTNVAGGGNVSGSGADFEITFE